MKKLLPIIIVILVVGGLGGYLLFQRDGLPSMSDQAEVVDQEDWISDIEEEGETFTGSLENMIGLNIPLRCTWSQEDASGTTWVKGRQFYTEVESQGQESQIIFKDDCMWAWSESEERGMKMCFDADQAEEIISGEADTPEATQLPTDMSFNCRPAAITDARFNPPTDVQFIDLDEFMPGTLE